MAPETTLPTHPHTPGKGEDKGPSDHFPVRLSFSNPNLDRRARFKIPEWIANLPQLHEMIRERWDQQRAKSSHHPVKRWLAFKRVIRSCAMELMRTNREAAQSKAAALTLGISVLRSAGRGDPLSLWERASADPGLQQALDDDLCAQSTCFEKSRQYVRSCFASQPRVSPHTLKKPNFLQSAKSTLPQGNRSLTHINLETGESLHGAADMARALKEHWEPVWNTANPSRDRIDGYLADYHKQVDKDDVLPLTQELVAENSRQEQGLLHRTRWHPLLSLPQPE